MKTKLTTVLLVFVTMLSFAQKKELKVVEKALKKGNIEAAEAALEVVTPLIKDADVKLKSKYYFISAKILKAKKDYKATAKAFEVLLDFEKEIGKKRYTDEARVLLVEIKKEVSEKAMKFYNEKEHLKSSESFYLAYLMDKRDTALLYNAAILTLQSKEKKYELTLKYYGMLKDMKYTGIKTVYKATNKETKEDKDFPSKLLMDIEVKTGMYINPREEVLKSKQSEILKNMGLILSSQNRTEEAIKIIKEARKENPKDLNLLLTEADLYSRLNKMDEFSRLIGEAVKQDPNNHLLYFNLGIANAQLNKREEAKKYYIKTIELKPDYGNAYMNLAILILDGEQAIVDKMNKLPYNANKKYKALEKKRKELYKEALPYLEKADTIKRTADVVKTLINIYDNLENDAKSSEYRKILKGM